MRAVFHDTHPDGVTSCGVCDRDGTECTSTTTDWSGPVKGHLVTFNDGAQSWAADHELEAVAS